MATTSENRAPVHLWIVGILSLLWSCFGCYDYTMTRMRNTDYIASAMPGVDPNAALAGLERNSRDARSGNCWRWIALLPYAGSRSTPS